jgi:two-component system sensor kinase FixL
MARVAAISGWAARGSNGYGLAIAAVGLALLARLGLEAFGKFYYLPLIPAVMLPALLASRRATALAIILSIAANVVLVSRESLVDAVVNALLFALVGAAIGEIGRARRSLKARSMELKTQLNTRNATIHAMQASAPVVTLDAHSIILAISQPACALFRTAEREATGRPFQDFVEFFDAGVVRSSPPGEYSADQYWLGRRADGDVFPLGIQLAFVTGDPGTSEAILTLTDLSLWHSAELRSQELSDQLNQVWRMNSLGEMAAILSHELNQPLTAAASYLQASQVDLGRAGIMADNASRTVELAKSQVLRAGAIIRRARELLTVETQPLEPERMSSMIDDLGPIIQLLGPASDAGIQISIDNIDDRVMADRIQFQQAIVNLVRNAVEAVADRERREVRLIGRPTSAEFYEIRVEDSGPGVAPDQVERMFEPLMTTKSDGMGLGLSVTRTIVENHGGSLTVGRSEMGGAAFTFSLQRVKEEPIL